MKHLAILVAAVGLAACDARVEVPAPVEKNTTVVNPPAGEKVENKTTIVNPPAPAGDVTVEKKTTTTTTSGQ